MVRIRFADTTEATLEGRRWRSACLRRERLLNAMVAPWSPYPGENAELREARVAAKVLGAEIVEAEVIQAEVAEAGSSAG